MLKAVISALALAATLTFSVERASAQSGPPVAVVDDHAIYHDPDAPELGNPKGDVTIVEFFDYQCPYCRKLHPDLMRLVQEDGRIRLVLKDWPILSPFSKVAAKVALAAKYQGKHAAAHAALMAIPGRLDQQKIDAAAASAELDAARLNADAQAHKDEIEALLARTNQIAESIDLTGTPALIIGPFLAPGGMSYDNLKKAVAQARATQAKPKG
ncbi:disulfide bond formation protein DsbA [Alsobacter soli]|uniref:Disulfide bond formation protein DsbA n=1 Tax=Alsobacter soli TaxID=2109933 RepID=A0A2T1HLH4_9HYPH|nr:DsbA family protein [Alsobacter soli]PSC02492.1 disulfide bond formation protein DsbA [Alsobacter soli]